MRGRILVVDDDPAILEVVRLNLEAEGYDVVTADDAAGARCARSRGPLRAGRPRRHAARHRTASSSRAALRERSDIPIMMLSARDSDVDKAVGLGVGADDYVTKPFSPLELVARVKAHLRRYGSGRRRGAEPAQRRRHRGGPVRIDLGRQRVTVRGTDVELTAKEFDILRLLAEHPGRVYTKAQIYERVWGEDAFGDLSTVQVHVRRLRTKIEEHPDEPDARHDGVGHRLPASRRARGRDAGRSPSRSSPRSLVGVRRRGRPSAGCDARARLRRVAEGVAELARGNLAHRVHPARRRRGRADGRGRSTRWPTRCSASARPRPSRDEAQRRLLANISHDLRTPITSIAGYVDALQRGLGDEPERYLGVHRGEGRRARAAHRRPVLRRAARRRRPRAEARARSTWPRRCAAACSASSRSSRPRACAWTSSVPDERCVVDARPLGGDAHPLEPRGERPPARRRA